jgi:hypothetical protein
MFDTFSGLPTSAQNRTVAPQISNALSRVTRWAGWPHRKTLPDVVAFLCSDSAEFITGQSTNVAVAS